MDGRVETVARVEVRQRTGRTRDAASELLYDMWGDADALIERVDDFTDPKRQERARINSVRRSLWLEGRVAPLMLLVICHLRHSLRAQIQTSLVSEVGASRLKLRAFTLNR